jgi:hypothetical protein
LDCEHVFDRLLPTVERNIKEATVPLGWKKGPSSFDGGSKIEIPGINHLVQKADVRSHRPMASAHL